MSIQNILKPGTEKQGWSKIYSSSLNCATMTCENIVINGLIPSEVENLTINDTLKVNGLTPNMAIKTDGVNNLISQNLEISDVNNLQSTLDGKLGATLTDNINGGGIYNITGINQLEVKEIISELVVQDPLFQINADAADDDNDVGFFAKFPLSDTNSGLIRDPDTSIWHLYDNNGSTPPSGYTLADGAPLRCGEITTPSVGITSTGDDWKISDNNGALEVINDSGVQFYSFRPAGYTHQYSSVGRVGVEYKSSNGTIAAPTATTNGASVTELLFSGHNGASYVYGGAYIAQASENWSIGNNGTRAVIQITPNGTTGRKTYFDVNGANISIGDGATNYKLPVVRGTVNQTLRTDGVGVVSWESPNFGEVGFGNNLTQTVFSAVNEWQIIAGTYAQYSVDNFSLQTNQLRYDGATVKNFRIMGSVSVEKVASQDVICRLSIFSNGVGITRSEQVQSTSNTAVYPQHVSTNAIVTLNTGDLIDVRVQNNTNSDGFIITNLQLIITEV